MDLAATIILLIFSSCVLLLCASFFRVCSSPVEAIHLSFVVIAVMLVISVAAASVISDCALCIRYDVFCGPAMSSPTIPVN